MPVILTTDEEQLRSLTNGPPSRTNLCTRRKRTCAAPKEEVRVGPDADMSIPFANLPE